MNETLTVLRSITQALDQANIPYMLSGSMAMSKYPPAKPGGFNVVAHQRRFKRRPRRQGVVGTNYSQQLFFVNSEVDKLVNKRPHSKLRGMDP